MGLHQEIGEIILGEAAASHDAGAGLRTDDPALIKLVRVVNNLTVAVLRLAKEVEELQRRS